MRNSLFSSIESEQKRTSMVFFFLLISIKFYNPGLDVTSTCDEPESWGLDPPQVCQVVGGGHQFSTMWTLLNSANIFKIYVHRTLYIFKWRKLRQKKIIFRCFDPYNPHIRLFGHSKKRLTILKCFFIVKKNYYFFANVSGQFNRIRTMLLPDQNLTKFRKKTKKCSLTILHQDSKSLGLMRI